MAKELGPGPHQEPEPGHTEAAHTKSRPRDTGESQMGPYSTLEQAGAGKGRCSALYISGFSWLWFTVAKWRFKQAQEPDEETGPAAMSENQEPSHTRMPACLLHDQEFPAPCPPSKATVSLFACSCGGCRLRLHGQGSGEPGGLLRAGVQQILCPLSTPRSDHRCPVTNLCN